MRVVYFEKEHVLVPALDMCFELGRLILRPNSVNQAT